MGNGQLFYWTLCNFSNEDCCKVNLYLSKVTTFILNIFSTNEKSWGTPGDRALKSEQPLVCNGKRAQQRDATANDAHFHILYIPFSSISFPQWDYYLIIIEIAELRTDVETRIWPSDLHNKIQGSWIYPLPHTGDAVPWNQRERNLHPWTQFFLRAKVY